MSLQAFQDDLNENIMAVPVSNAELGHAALTMKKVNFTTANSGTYTNPISSGDMSSKSTATGCVTTRSATEATAGSAGTIKWHLQLTYSRFKKQYASSYKINRHTQHGAQPIFYPRTQSSTVFVINTPQT